MRFLEERVVEKGFTWTFFYRFKFTHSISMETPFTAHTFVSFESVIESVENDNTRFHR